VGYSIYLKSSVSPSPPSYSFSSTEWQEFITLSDSDKFKSLDDRIEYSSEFLADWIQIDWINEGK